MPTLNTKRSFARCVCVSIGLCLAPLMLAGQARAVVIGTNPFLNPSGTLFIPLSPDDSGVLGQVLPRGQQVGLQADHVRLTGNGATSEGEITFTLIFNLAAGEMVQPANGAIVVSASDLDFRKTSSAHFSYDESMKLAFLRQPTDASGLAPLVVDGSNYGLFHDGGFVQTNDRRLDYAFGLASDLHLTQADFDSINATRQFALRITLDSHLTHVSRGGGGFDNTRESVVAALTEVPGIPEPASLAILASGALAVAGRRRR